jgi:ADP-heptose:LPS heptosyltransferase
MVDSQFPQDSTPTLTVLRALGLGDLLVAVPALRALARAFPGHRRVLAAPTWLEPLLPLIEEGGEPCLHRLAEVGGLEAGAERLPSAPKVGVNLHGRGPQSHRMLGASRPQRLIAFRNDTVPESRMLPIWQENEHEAERWCRLLRESGIEGNPEQLEISSPSVDLPAWAHGATLLHPGAASAARRWPPERWAAVARSERAAGREVLITGSRREVGLARWIATAAGLQTRSQLAGRTDLRHLAALVSAADTIVSGDTGTAHLATALGVPSVLLFGPTSPRRWGPPPERRIHRVLWEGTSGDPHAETVDPGLLEIGVDSALEAIESLR